MIARYLIIVLLLLMPSLSFSADIHVGEGQTNTELDTVNWPALVAGDTVYIHYRATPYATKIGLQAQGTALSPVTISGIPDENGNLPTITGVNATTPPSLSTWFSYEWDESQGVILIKRGTMDYGQKPTHIIIENLKLTGANENNTYTAMDGSTRNYVRGAAGIFAILEEDLIIRNCEIVGNGNGLFVLSKGSVEELSTNLTVQNNWIHDNGVVASDRQHNIYTQVAGVALFEKNRLGTLISGALGSNLKDRSSGTTIRFNWMESGARTIDLVDPEDARSLIVNDPNFQKTWIYGNVLIDDYRKNKPLGITSSAAMIQYGGDSGREDEYRNGTLYFYNNTVFVNADTSHTWRLYIFKMNLNTANVDFYNNIIIKDGTTNFSVGGTMGVYNWLGKNILTTGTLDTMADYPFTGTWNETTPITHVTNAEINTADQRNYDFSILSPSAAIGTASSLPVAINTAHNITEQYVLHQSSKARASLSDVGWWAYDGTLSCSTTPALCLTQSTCESAGWSYCDSACQSESCEIVDPTASTIIGIFKLNGSMARAKN